MEKFRNFNDYKDFFATDHVREQQAAQQQWEMEQKEIDEEAERDRIQQEREQEEYEREQEDNDEIIRRQWEDEQAEMRQWEDEQREQEVQEQEEDQRQWDMYAQDEYEWEQEEQERERLAKVTFMFGTETEPIGTLTVRRGDDRANAAWKLLKAYQDSRNVWKQLEGGDDFGEVEDKWFLFSEDCGPPDEPLANRNEWDALSNIQSNSQIYILSAWMDGGESQEYYEKVVRVVWNKRRTNYQEAVRRIRED